LYILQSSALKKQKIQKQFQASFIILTGFYILQSSALKKTKNPKTISSELHYFDWIIYPTKLRFENTIKTKKRSS
jgi:hypothetical protein